MKTVASIFALALVLSLSITALADNCEDAHDGALTDKTKAPTTVVVDNSGTSEGTKD